MSKKLLKKLDKDINQGNYRMVVQKEIVLPTLLQNGDNLRASILLEKLDSERKLNLIIPSSTNDDEIINIRIKENLPELRRIENIDDTISNQDALTILYGKTTDEKIEMLNNLEINKGIRENQPIIDALERLRLNQLDLTGVERLLEDINAKEELTTQEIQNLSNIITEIGTQLQLPPPQQPEQTGSGCMIKNDNDDIVFGKIMIRKDPLMRKNILNCYKGKGMKKLRINGLPNTAISDDFKRLLLNNKINSNKMKLSNDELALFSKLTNIAKVSLDGKKKDFMNKYFMDLEEAEKRLSTLVGSLVSGNNSIRLKNEILEIISLLERSGVYSPSKAVTMIKRFELDN